MTNTQENVVQIPPCWVELQKPLKAALGAMEGRWTAKDVFEEVINGRAHWWPGEKSVVVTKLYDSGDETVLLFWLAGGNLEELEIMERAITAKAALECGATVSRIEGRRGWVKVLPGYEEVSVALERRIGE